MTAYHHLGSLALALSLSFRDLPFTSRSTLLARTHVGRIPPCAYLALCGHVWLIAFLPRRLLMVAIHGWNNFLSMITGWKRNPEYVIEKADRLAARGPIKQKSWCDE